MEKKLKVAHVIRVFSYGGAEILLRECFAHPYFKENLHSDLYILDHKKLGLVNEVKSNIHAVHFYKISSLRFIIEYIKFICSIVKGKYDIVHMHLPAAGWMTIAAKLFTPKAKYIYSEHNLVTYYAKHNYYLIGFLYRFFDYIIYVSPQVKAVVKNNRKGLLFKPKKEIVIVNGVDTNKFSYTYRSYNNFTVGLVARFRRQKRVDRWIGVAAEIYKLNPNIKFLMVGDGPDEQMLREKIKDLKLQQQIELPGMLKNTVEAFKRIDVFLLTSEFEGLPLALLESMSTGCVPVVSNVGGIKQLSFDNFGYKFNVFNAAEIASVIADYAINTQKIKTESLNARNFIERNYSLTKQVHEIVKLYKEVRDIK